MGQQSNKVIKRRRRANYLQRKKDQAKLGGIVKKAPAVKKEATKAPAKKAAKKAPAKKAVKKVEEPATEASAAEVTETPEAASEE